MMQFGLIALSPPGEITMLARAVFGIVVLFVGVVAVVRGIWSSLQTRPGKSPDLDTLWERYRRGEISWDEYLRGKVEGGRGLIGVEGARGLSQAKEEPSSNTTSPTVSGS